MRIAMMVGVASLALMSSAGYAQDVTYDYDRGTDFARIKTYAWAVGTPVRDELNHKRIVGAIDTQLGAKGLTKVEPGANPDVLVAYHANFGTELEIRGSSTEWGRFGLGWGGGNRTGSARVEEVQTGTLVVQIVDAKSRSTVWKGMASREIDTKASPEKRDKSINKAAEKLFKHYPPKQ